MSRNVRKYDALLIVALAGGANVKAAARKAGVSEKTAYRRLDDSDFCRRVDDARGRMFSSALGRLAESAVKAVQTLERLLAAENNGTVRVSAARSILEFGGRLREATEFSTRLAAVESKLQAVDSE